MFVCHAELNPVWFSTRIKTLSHFKACISRGMNENLKQHVITTTEQKQIQNTTV